MPVILPAEAYDRWLANIEPDPRDLLAPYLLVGVNAVSGVVEHWLFIVDGTARGTVVWGSIRGALPKSSLMEARCDGR